MGIEDLATVAVDCGFKLHKEIGPGLVEALRERGIAVERQVPAPVQYMGVVVDNAFRMDLLVERILVIELKSTERDSALYPKQLLTYLRLLDLPLGLLMNFGQETFKQGVQRVVNNHREFGSSHS
jgi:iron complex transport system substrate-binding protein